MKVFNRDPRPATASPPGGGRLPRRWPIATVSVLAVTVVLTVLQFPFPQVRLDLWRAPGALWLWLDRRGRRTQTQGG
jgi:hypothetical protein